MPSMPGQHWQDVSRQLLALQALHAEALAQSAKHTNGSSADAVQLPVAVREAALIEAADIFAALVPKDEVPVPCPCQSARCESAASMHSRELCGWRAPPLEFDSPWCNSMPDPPMMGV